MKQVYATHSRKVCLVCLWRMPVVCAQLLSGTIADLSSREHRLAICPATDSLCCRRDRNLYPILDRASRKCAHSHPARFLWRLVRESSPERRTLTTGFSFLETFAALDIGSPADQREALCSFAVLHDVRRLGIACISVVHTISDVVSSNAEKPQPAERSTTLISTLTVPTELLHTFTRDARGGDVSRGEIAAARGPPRPVDFAV